MNIASAAAFAVFCAVMGYLLKEIRSPLAACFPLFGAIPLLLSLCEKLPAVAPFTSLLSRAGLEEETAFVGKVLGIGYLGEIGGDVCRDLGAPSLASRLEFFARAEILFLCLPLLSDLVEKATEAFS